VYAHVSVCVCEYLFVYVCLCVSEWLCVYVCVSSIMSVEI